MNGLPLIKTEGLTKVYSVGAVRVSALSGISISVGKGQFLGVAGVSGSGKSTLLNLLGGLDTPSAGSIEFEGRKISEMNRDELALYRRFGVGMIFQSFNLLPSDTAVENVAFPLLFSGVRRPERLRRAAEMLESVGLLGRRNHRPSELSGGEQQRLAIARAMVNKPRLILADEPTGNLDSRTSLEIVKTLAGLNRDRGLTVIMVSHEEELLRRFAGRVIRLHDGEVADTEDGRALL